MGLGIGLGLVGFGSYPAGSSLLDGSEADGTNLLTGGKEDFSSGWSTIDATLTANAALSPAGTTTAAEVLEAATTHRHGAYVRPTIVAGSSHPYSIYAKSVTRRYMQIFIAAEGSSGQVYAYFDLLTGVVTDSGVAANGGSTAIGTPTIAAAVNGFYKCIIPSVVMDGVSTAPYFQIMCSDVATFGAPLVSNSPDYAGNTANGLRIWRPKVV